MTVTTIYDGEIAMTNMTIIPENYKNIRAEIVELLKTARSTAARNVNSIMTATYWEIGRRIVQSEQGGAARANYGDELIKQLANNLSAQFGRGFGVVNLSQMRRFFLAWPTKGGHRSVATPSRGYVSWHGQSVVGRDARRFEWRWHRGHAGEHV
jgi:hypothetical protein